ncbi:hypothetical protein CTAM01_09446 [Colletotrichum tamarilloi]|uniref:Uncharacterized protein n=1 Tax=Colletotrichum tamarilloi TaxID=1209934 RepID=A0ABQ9R3F2_9PEZI|nr:uncharacterized protein CTAM01_09446 [Colletotrichum tamarilloi]KAK1493302.1 hypothetical protein CTAM01_09446 [Colletotrichum tamarilloi]
MTLRLIIIGTRLQHSHPDTSSFYIKPIIHTISSHVLSAFPQIPLQLERQRT